MKYIKIIITFYILGFEIVFGAQDFSEKSCDFETLKQKLLCDLWTIQSLKPEEQDSVCISEWISVPTSPIVLTETLTLKQRRLLYFIICLLQSGYHKLMGFKEPYSEDTFTLAQEIIENDIADIAFKSLLALTYVILKEYAIVRHNQPIDPDSLLAWQQNIRSLQGELMQALKMSVLYYKVCSAAARKEIDFYRGSLINF
jgi:hypothetical protein